MTAICGGGTSGPKVGVAAIVDYSAGLIAAIFAAYDLTWLIPVIPLVGLGPLALNTFCATDPPAVPTFTAAETDALLTLHFGADFDSGLAKFRDLLLNIIWYDACQCTTGSPTPLTPPTPPTGTPITQPPPSPATQRVCFTQTSVGAMADPPGTYTASQWNIYLTSGGPFPQANVHIELSATGNGTHRYPTWNVRWRNHSSGVATAFPIGGGNIVDVTLDIPSGYDQLLLEVVEPVTDANVTWKATINGLCSDSIPGSQTSPCCPPDPATQSYLDNILKLVTLIQRQTTPFAYVTGDAHSSLSGSGEIDVQGLLGCKVQLASVPQWASIDSGDPDTLWLDSWINWGNPDGWTAREFLRSAPFISLPPLAGQFTKIGYSLRPGLSVTITELTREP